MKILIVEDDTDVREGIEQVLEDEGFLWDSVDNGLEALYRAENWEYDAIILDVMLPKVDGWEVLRRLKKPGSAPVLMLTALGGLPDRVRGLDGGADDFITKPFEPEELLARIRVVTRRRSGRQNNVIDLGRVRIDLKRMQVMLDEELVDLRPAEYRILVFLAQRRGRPQTAAEIIDATSGEDSETDVGVMKTQIYRLRKKLGKDLIQNRRGLGYTIADDV